MIIKNLKTYIHFNKLLFTCRLCQNIGTTMVLAPLSSSLGVTVRFYSMNKNLGSFGINTILDSITSYLTHLGLLWQ
jgi:hypothetical protein